MNKKGKKTLKGLLLAITISALFLYTPLKAEEEELQTSQAVSKSITIENIIDTTISSSKTKSILNSESDLQLSKEQKLHSTGFNLSRKQRQSYPELKKITNKHNTLNKIESSLYTTSLITLVAFNVMDFYTTTKALKYKGLREANPVMAPITKNTYLFAAVKLGITTLNFYLLKKVHKNNKTLAWVLSIASNLIVSYAVINNTKLIQKAQRQQ